MKTLLPFLILLIVPTFGFAQVLTRAEALERIEKATPASLPQSPRVPKAKTDVEDERLKGRVRSITYAVLESDSATPRLTRESFYDESGGLTKMVSYNFEGNPWTIRVFGYLDGKRISKGSYISYGYDPPAPPLRKLATPEPPADTRFEYSEVFKHDDARRLVEKLLYRNNGVLLSREVFSYNGDTVESTTYDRSGKANSRTIAKYDKDGYLIEKSRPDPDGAYGTSVYRYKYDAFDAQGNWTRATVTGKAGQYGGGQKDFQQTEIRTITYY
ncbi:MAG TPA: hypothetical protein VFZ23_05485 [Pyrinomonadaceae bacterium]